MHIQVTYNSEPVPAIIELIDVTEKKYILNKKIDSRRGPILFGLAGGGGGNAKFSH